MRSSVSAASVWAFARWSGSVTGSLSFANFDRAVVLTPDNALSAGENVMVFVSHDVRGADGSPMREAGYSYQFWTKSQQAPLE